MPQRAPKAPYSQGPVYFAAEYEDERGKAPARQKDWIPNLMKKAGANLLGRKSLPWTAEGAYSVSARGDEHCNTLMKASLRGDMPPVAESAGPDEALPPATIRLVATPNDEQ